MQGNKTDVSLIHHNVPRSSTEPALIAEKDLLYLSSKSPVGDPSQSYHPEP
jgi:hypothetical protein